MTPEMPRSDRSRQPDNARDQDAVQAALDLPWTTSPVEGQVNRIETIKRSMYGRAGFDLLRARVLNAA